MTNQDLQALKNKFDIIGNDPALNRALEIAVAVAPTDITVLITGESGVGKENIPRIVHQNSRRKNGKYFAINCGAIPEGTIDSELFGHEKGSFTGANEMRKGYFEEADGGTLYKVAPRGWLVSSNTEWWGVNRGGGNGDPVATDGAHIFGVWDGRNTLSPSISQTINGLPAGNYTLTVDMHVSGTMAESRLGNQCLFAGDESVRFRDQMLTCGTGDNFPMQTLVLYFTQQKEKTPITIGVRTEGAPAQTWFKIDNFRLYATIDEDFVPTRITSTGNPQRVVAIEMFDLSGRRISRMQRGVNIVRMKMADGNVKIEKIIK